MGVCNVILYVWRYIPATFTKIAVIDHATSIIWVRRYNSAGEFELYLPASAELLELFTTNTIERSGQTLKVETLLSREDEETMMIVEKVELTTDAENGDYLTISGRSAESIIGRRIIPKQTNFNGTTENFIRTLLNENIISPAQSIRKISVFTLGTSQGYTETINKQVTGKNLLETISDVCSAYEYGFKLTFTGAGFAFDLYKGVDRSLNQTENNRVIFSPAFENLGNTSYSHDYTEYYNGVFVAGEGEGSERVIQPVNADNYSSGMNRRELWIDARQTSSDTDDGQLTPAEYSAILVQQGKEEIENNRDKTSFGGEILDMNVYVFGVDYGLGDKVSIVNEYGITGTATVIEITEVEDETGYKIYPTLSEWSV